MTDAPTSSQTSTPSPAPKKKKSMGRLLARIAVVLVLLVLIGLVALYFSLNPLVRAGVVRGGEYATKQTTTLNMANLSLAGGALSLDQLEINNIQPDYHGKLLVMKRCDVTMKDPWSVLTPTVLVDAIEVDGLEITIEQHNGKNNLSDLMEILKQQSPAAGSTTSTSPGKQLKISKIVLTHPKVHVRAAPLPDMDLDLGTIELDDPTNPDGRPMKIADLIAKVFLHVAQQVVNDPRLPPGIKDGMKNVTALVNNMQGELSKDAKVLQGDLNDLSKDPAKALQNAGKDA